MLVARSTERVMAPAVDTLAVLVTSRDDRAGRQIITIARQYLMQCLETVRPNAYASAGMQCSHRQAMQRQHKAHRQGDLL